MKSVTWICRRHMIDMYNTNFIFTHIFSTDLSANKSFYKELFHAVEYTGKNIKFVVNRLNSLGNELSSYRGDMYNLINRSSNTSFFNNTVMIAISNKGSNLELQDNVYYLMVSGEPKQWYSDDTYIDVDTKELLNQIVLYTQAHKNNIVMGLDEVLRNTTGHFSMILYEAPSNNLYFFTSNKKLYLHTGDNSIWLSSTRPFTTELQVSCTSDLDNRTIYYSKINSKYVFKQYIVDDPLLKNNKYNLVCNYDSSIESFILPFITKEIFSPNNIEINPVNKDNYNNQVSSTDQLSCIESMFNQFSVITDNSMSKGELLYNLGSSIPMNYIDYTNDSIEIEQSEHLAAIQTGVRYLPVFRYLQDYEILLLGVYLNVPFRKFNSKCKHAIRDKNGNYTLCGECEECKSLYTKFAQLGYTNDDMPIKFKNYTELDKIKITDMIDMTNLTNEQYLAIRNKITEVFNFDNV